MGQLLACLHTQLMSTCTLSAASLSRLFSCPSSTTCIGSKEMLDSIRRACSVGAWFVVQLLTASLCGCTLTCFTSFATFCLSSGHRYLSVQVEKACQQSPKSVDNLNFVILSCQQLFLALIVPWTCVAVSYCSAYNTGLESTMCGISALCRSATDELLFMSITAAATKG